MPRRFTQERKKDPYYRAAKSEGLRSRAAFKLEQLSRSFGLVRRGDAVLDLGAAPGGWSIVARQLVGRSGRVVAVDERRIDPIEGVERIRGRVGSADLAPRLGGSMFDVVLSDLSPRISGAYATDHARSIDLVRTAFALAKTRLKPDGRFVAKAFDGDLLPELEEELRPYFQELRRSKPAASRGQSSELYVLALGFLGVDIGP